MKYKTSKIKRKILEPMTEGKGVERWRGRDRENELKGAKYRLKSAFSTFSSATLMKEDNDSNFQSTKGKGIWTTILRPMKPTLKGEDEISVFSTHGRTSEVNYPQTLSLVGTPAKRKFQLQEMQEAMVSNQISKSFGFYLKSN